MYRILIFVALLALGYVAYDNYGYRFYLNHISQNVEDQMVMGNKDGDVTVITYLDYESASSRRIYTMLLNLLAVDPNIRLIIRPVEINSDPSILATRMALSAKDQNKFMQVNNFFLSRQIEMDANFIQSVMRTMGLRYERLRYTMDSESIAQEAQSYKREAKLLGVKSIPYFFIEHVRMPGNVMYKQDNLKEIISRLRSRRL